ncbi:MAG: DUF4198 domain-containing protein [Gammaproteobacteria bacterium]|nr:DUF4198 domain-containing protein [Gammaproteobacteria bacterium]MBU1625225.1 DUF4198 domain-containing protein [Gammaproteobacteria bacterium]MBU1981485.1 DUF4198 domain-containing protein [Gammaproteobacteria bacterium]
MRILYSACLLVACTATASAAEPAAMATHDHSAMMRSQSRAWTQLPVLKARMKSQDMSSRSYLMQPLNIAADAVEAWSNDLNDPNGHRRLPMEMGGAPLDKPATGGFQMLTAREEQGDVVRVATTVHYFSERGGKNPTAMFEQVKHELEIVPQPYPREHSRYRTNEDWQFAVRFKGQPLVAQKVVLETSNGSRSEFMTDALGGVKVKVPNDFKAEAAQVESHGRRRGADFVLAVSHAEGGLQYLTAFNSGYGEDAYANRSLAMGMGFMLVGMLGAAPLLRNRKTAARKEESANA